MCYSWMAAVRIHIQSMKCIKLQNEEKGSAIKTLLNLCISGNFEVETLVKKVEAPA